MATLHYIFDPLCGWCYAAAPLVAAAHEVPGLTIVLHGGGMLTGAHRREITPQWRDYVLPHDNRIEEMTGQPFGEGYKDGLLRETGTVLDSEPPTTAILAADAVAGRGLDMLRRLQQAHYVEGRHISERDVLDTLAVDLGLNAEAFTAAYDRLAGPSTDEHFDESRQWLAQAGGQGFPTMALEVPGDPAQGEPPTLARVDVGSFLGQPRAFAQALRDALEARA